MRNPRCLILGGRMGPREGTWQIQGGDLDSLGTKVEILSLKIRVEGECLAQWVQMLLGGLALYHSK